MSCCGINDVFDAENLLVKEYGNWKLVVRNRNTTLGNGVIVLKRHAESMSELMHEEYQELQDPIQDFEHAVKKVFGAVKFNYFILMLQEDHVHIHCIPRYDKPVKFNGKTFKDTGWPGKPAEQQEALPEETLFAVRDALKEVLF